MNKAYFLFCAVILLFSCNTKDCNNTNPVLTANEPDSEPYKTELAGILESGDTNNVRYYVDGYNESGGTRVLHVTIEADSICAKAGLLIANTTKGIEQIIAKKGVGYNGAELQGLEYDIVWEGEKTAFLYRGVDSVED